METTKIGSHIDEDKASGSVFDPWNPSYPPYDSSVHKSYREKRFIEDLQSNQLIIPDRIPQEENATFYKIAYPLLLPILKMDSVRRFLSFFVKRGEFITRGFIITPEAFNQMIVEDALRCAELAMEGKAPEMEGFRANPNCMNRYGYFPLHEAAERFSVDMIKLLLHHGASTDLRTAGDLVIEDLLPLHVAVENTCLHKYLEDGLHPNGENPNYSSNKDANYIYKLIHLLCLPEMKIFLDTTRLLAEHTNTNLVNEIWNYIKHGKLVQTAVLLLSAQAHIRVGSFSNTNGDKAVDGFATVITRIAEHSLFLKSEMGQEEKELLDREANCELLSPALLLVNIISQTGKALNLYIRSRSHQEVPREKVFEHVSSILNDDGFFPSEECVRIGNLCPYNWSPRTPKKRGKKATEAATETSYLHHADKKRVNTKLRRRRERENTWNNFIPYWRSVLAWRYPIQVYPSYSNGSLKQSNFDHLHNSGSNSAGKLSIPIQAGNACSLPGRTPQITSTLQSRRLFGSVALTVLKMLKTA